MGSRRARMESSAGVAEKRGAIEVKRDWKGRVIHEARRFLVIFLYLWVLFGLFVLYESIVLAKHDIDFTAYGLAITNALILAKVMLVAEDLNIARGFEDKPLVYPVLYKSVVFAVVFLGFRVAEEALVGMWHGKPALESVPAIGGGSPKGILSVALIVSFALIPYFAFREVGRAIGEGELRALFLTRGPQPRAADSVATSADGPRSEP